MAGEEAAYIDTPHLERALVAAFAIQYMPRTYLDALSPTSSKLYHAVCPNYLYGVLQKLQMLLSGLDRFESLADW